MERPRTKHMYIFHICYIQYGLNKHQHFQKGVLKRMEMYQQKLQRKGIVQFFAGGSAKESAARLSRNIDYKTLTSCVWWANELKNSEPVS